MDNFGLIIGVACIVSAVTALAIALSAAVLLVGVVPVFLVFAR